MTTQSQPQPDHTVRNIVIGVVVVAILALGYCASKVAKMAGTIVDATKGIAARTDTTHHVAAGSAVFLNGTKVADIVKVLVIRADTTPAPPAHGVDSIMQAGLRQQTVVYAIAKPAADVATQLDDIMLVGKVDGTYDDSAPVQITLSKRDGSPPQQIAPVQLLVPGRRAPISVY